mgnify:CR=1 FL=1
MRQRSWASEKQFIDYAGPTLPVIYPTTGEISRAHIFVVALGPRTTAICACATPEEALVDWLGALSQAFKRGRSVPGRSAGSHQRSRKADWKILFVFMHEYIIFVLVNDFSFPIMLI